jgi:hypothetical protein
MSPGISNDKTVLKHKNNKNTETQAQYFKYNNYPTAHAIFEDGFIVL